MDLQKLVDMLGENERMTRGKYQITLGKAIKALADLNGDLPIVLGGADTGSPGDPDSYRGYYSDLAFELSSKAITVREFAAACSVALGNAFQGYKGGDFIMSESTPLWIANYGCCGNAIVGIEADSNRAVLVTKDVE